MASAATELPRSSPLELWKTRVVWGGGHYYCKMCGDVKDESETSCSQKYKYRLGGKLEDTWKTRRKAQRNTAGGGYSCCCCGAVLSGGEGEARCDLISLTDYISSSLQQ